MRRFAATTLSLAPVAAKRRSDPDHRQKGHAVATSASEVAKQLYLVFSAPPDSVSDEEFNRWYETHLDEILQTPGFVAAQRYRLAPVRSGGDQEVAYRYLVVWEIDADIERLRSELARRAASEEMTFPAWFSDIRYMTWDCEPLGARIVADAAPQAPIPPV